jgi:hypothetical protein
MFIRIRHEAGYERIVRCDDIYEMSLSPCGVHKRLTFNTPQEVYMVIYPNEEEAWMGLKKLAKFVDKANRADHLPGEIKDLQDD